MSSDVVVPVYRDVRLTRLCLEAVLRTGGSSLSRLLVVDDCSPEPDMRTMLLSLRQSDPRVRVLATKVNSGFVVAANLGLFASDSDVVILNSDTLVTRGWLTELLRVLTSDGTIAAASPLSNNAGACSVPRFNVGVPVSAVDVSRLQLRQLPRFTPMPTAHGFCLALRRTVLDQIGGFDPAYGRGYQEENDWCQRARGAGFLVGRANRAFVYHHGAVSFGSQRARLDVVNARRLLIRYPTYRVDCAAFEASAEARVAADAVARQLGPKSDQKGSNGLDFERPSGVSPLSRQARH